MDALGDLLAPYSAEIAKFAGTVTCLQFLSGIFLLNDIRKRGKSDAYPPEPFLGGVVLSSLNLKLGFIMGQSSMINTNIIGLILNFMYATAFYWYATSEFKIRMLSKARKAGLLILVLLAYASFENPEKIQHRLSMVITGFLTLLVGTPVLRIPLIMKKKSTEGMPFPIMLSGTSVASSWTLFAISIRNAALAYQYMFLASLGAISLSMFVLYPGTNGGKKDKLKGASKKDNGFIQDNHQKNE